MNFNQRLCLLTQRNLIDNDIHQAVLRVREYIATQWQVDVETKQVVMMLIHLAKALGRIKRGYQARPLDKDIFSEIESAVCFPLILQRHKELLALLPIPIPDSEQTHLIANIYTLSLAQPRILINRL